MSRLLPIPPGANVIELFLSIIYTFLNKKAFVPGESFQPSLMLAIRARAYPSGAPL
jgi:hypothetical protein